MLSASANSYLSEYTYETLVFQEGTCCENWVLQKLFPFAEMAENLPSVSFPVNICFLNLIILRHNLEDRVKILWAKRSIYNAISYLARRGLVGLDSYQGQ